MRALATAVLVAPLLVLSQQSAAEVTVNSANDFQTTLDKLRAAIEESPASIVVEVDHAAAASGAGLDLAPTTLVVFGNPAAGTLLMQADRSIGLALPMKILVIETDDGVQLVYDDPVELASTYQLGDAAGVTERMSGLVGNLAAEAAN